MTPNREIAAILRSIPPVALVTSGLAGQVLGGRFNVQLI